MSALAPCPFCGGEAKVFGAYDAYAVNCASCNAYGPSGSKVEAIAAWNRRAPLPAEQPSNPVPRMGGNTITLTDKQIANIELAAVIAKNVGQERLADSLGGILARIVGQQTKGEGVGNG